MKFIFACCLCFSVAGSAFATDFTQPITDIDGKPVLTDPNDAHTVLTLGYVVASALLSPPDAHSAQPPSNANDMAKWALLALKLREAKDVTLSTEEIVEVKRAVAEHYPRLTVLRVLQAIAPGDLAKK